MKAIDYNVVDMPTDLSRRVLMQNPIDSNAWVRDDKWYKDIKEMYSSLYKFLQDYYLIESKLNEKPIDEVVLKLSDFTERGKKLVKSGAIDRWLCSFDRLGSKKAFSDVRYLEKILLDIS